MKILRAGARECFNELPLVVDWAPTMKCNYRCSYCFDYGKGKNPPPQLPFSTLEQLKVAVDNIASLNRPWYNVTLSGGEPTIHQHISDLIVMLHETLGERLNQVVLLTNGSRNKDLYQKLATIAKEQYIRVNISIHTDHVDMAHILELIENLSNDVNIGFALMFNPAKREMVHDIYETLFEYRKKYLFGMSSYLLRIGDHLDPRYNEEDLTWQKEANERFKALTESVKSPILQVRQPRQIKHVFHDFHDIEDNGILKTIENADTTLKYTNGLFGFAGMYCMAHTNVLSISENGYCKGMVCGDDPILCNIYEKNSLMAVRDKLIHAIKCKRPMCGCSANYHIPKFASEEEARKYFIFAYKKQMALLAEGDAENALRDYKKLISQSINH